MTEEKRDKSKSALEVAAELAKLGTNPTEVAGAAKLAASSAMRIAGAVTKGSIDAATDFANKISSGEPLSEIVDGQVEQVRSVARAAIGAEEAGCVGRSRNLRDRGDDLIARSWSASNQPRFQHPAFDRILDEITPDEARILRFLALRGAQPTVDIRTNTPFGIGSQRLAAGVSFIADMAGCAWPDRGRHYLGNLNRLGLLSFSKEAVEDFRRYSVLEAHPETVAAMRRVRSTIAEYRSIHLSVFGEQFCGECFTLEGYDAGGWGKSRSRDLYWGKGPRLPKPLE